MGVSLLVHDQTHIVPWAYHDRNASVNRNCTVKRCKTASVHADTHLYPDRFKIDFRGKIQRVMGRVSALYPWFGGVVFIIPTVTHEVEHTFHVSHFDTVKVLVSNRNGVNVPRGNIIRNI